MRRLAFLAAASLGLGVAVIVDQPAAFAACDRGSCPCRDASFWGDSVDDSKCPSDKFCAQVVAERYGKDHVYVCEPRKPKGWGCTRDRQCKCGMCRNGKCFEKGPNDYDKWCRRDGKACGQCREDCRKQCRERTGSDRVCRKGATRQLTNGRYSSVYCD